VPINRAGESIRINIKISAEESPGLRANVA
jgi:hypothetical protein